nr:succinate dehydrogenase subunit 3 [Gracilaria edulis]
MYNRPLSPHITIYNLQISSLASIWHRISGILLAFSIVFFFIILQMVIHFYNNNFLLYLLNFCTYILYFYLTVCLLFLFSFFYHAINGLKQILWDIGFFINKKFIFNFFVSLSFFICFIILILLF